MVWSTDSSEKSAASASVVARPSTRWELIRQGQNTPFRVIGWRTRRTALRASATRYTAYNETQATDFTEYTEWIETRSAPYSRTGRRSAPSEAQHLYE